MLDIQGDESGEARSVSSAEGDNGPFTAADRLAIAETCPKFNRCSAPYCPALGGRHRRGERVCHYLQEAVKPGGPARVRAAIPLPLADIVAMDAIRLLNSTGPLQRPLERASNRGSRMESMKRANAFKRSRHD